MDMLDALPHCAIIVSKIIHENGGRAVVFAGIRAVYRQHDREGDDDA